MMDTRQRKYEDKLDELKKEVEKEVDNVMALHEQRDTAIQAKLTIEKVRTVILDQIKLDNEELVSIEKNIEKRRSVSRTMLDGLEKSSRTLKSNILDLEKREITLTNIISSMNDKIKKLKPLTNKYDKTVLLLRGTLEEIEKAKIDLESTEKKAEKILINAKKIEQQVMDKKTENEEWFARLQSFETSLNFYAERLRSWYRGKNLNLPVEYQPENVREKITQNG